MAIGALGGGTVQSALTAGGTAAAAPMITEVEKKIADNLAKQGIDATTAGSIANSLTGLTLTGIGASAGLDVASTANAVNIDANNRQLHPYEVDLINQNAKAFAKTLNGGKEPTVAQIQDARKRLTFQALKQIDSSWNSLISTNDIAAHNFLENLAKTSKSVNSGKVFTANDKDKNNQSVNSASIYHNRDNYNLYSLNGVRGSYIALDLAVSDYKDWKGKGLNEYKAFANSNFRQLASEIQNPYEQMAFGEAERSFYETAVNVGGYKPGSKENNALLPYYIHGTFSSPLPLETASNARIPNSGVKVNGKLPTTKGNRVSYNITDPRLVYEKDQFGNEILYRAMSPAQYKQMRITGKVPATKETFISPSQAYSSDYDGVLVKITVKPGTMNALKAQAGTGNSATQKLYPNLNRVEKGWAQNNQAQIKLEGTKKTYINDGKGVVNTGLGQSSALDKFNNSIVKFEKIGK